MEHDPDQGLREGRTRDRQAADAPTSRLGEWRDPAVARTLYGPDDRGALTTVLRGMADDLRIEPERVAARRRRRMVLRVALIVALVCSVAVATVAVAQPSYEFRQLQEGGQPVRWDVCAGVHYVINPRGGTTADQAEVHQAFAEVGSIMQTRFIYDGPVSERPSPTRAVAQPERYGRRWAPVLVAWSSARDPALSLPFATHGQTITVARANRGDLGHTYVTGQLLLNSDRRDDYPTAPPFGFTIRHEIGHLAGLSHAADPRQVMHAIVTPANRHTGWGAGDLAGLRRLGHAAGCQASAPQVPRS